MSFRFAILMDDYPYGYPLPDDLWSNIVREFFREYQYVGFNKVICSEDLGEEQEKFRLKEEKVIRVKINWSKKHGGRTAVERFMAFEIASGFMSRFYSFNLSLWNDSNYTFSEIYFFKNLDSAEDMVFVDGLDNSFTIFTESKEVPEKLLNIEGMHPEYFHYYEDVRATLFT